MAGDADPLLGTLIAGRYEVVRRIGQGGMATVYEVRHRDRQWSDLERRGERDSAISVALWTGGAAAVASAGVLWWLGALDDRERAGAAAGAPSIAATPGGAAVAWSWNF